MREIGIVVFFCEYNNRTDSFGNYGFISPYITLQGARRDIHVRDRDADPNIVRYDIVTFNKVETSRGYSAKDVRKLKNDKDVLRQLINNNNEEEYYKIKEFIKGYNSIAYTRFQKEILSGLSQDDVTGSLWILPSLGVDQLKQVIENRYTGTDKEHSDIFKKDKAFFEDRGEMAWFNKFYIDYIPVNIKRNIALTSEDALWAWPSLDADQLKEVIKNRYMGVDMDPEDTYINDKRYFENAGKATWFCSNYSDYIPDEIIKKSLLIMDDLPNLRKDIIIREHLKEGVFDYWDWDRKYLLKWPHMFIPTPDSVKYLDDELFQKLGKEKKVQCRILSYKADGDKTLARQQLLDVLKTVNFDDIYEIENDIPDDIIPTKEALQSISFNRKKEALLNSIDRYSDSEKVAILVNMLDSIHNESSKRKSEIIELLEGGVLNFKILESLQEILISQYTDTTISFLYKNAKLLAGINWIDDNIKVLLLYFMVKNNAYNEDILKITKPENNGNKVAVARLFYESGQSLKQGRCEEAEELFIKAHGALLSLMQLQDSKIADTKYLFPKCTNAYGKCSYCEAKFWIPPKDNENRKEYAYCTRTRKRYDLDNDCAHIKPQTNSSIGSWSLLEFLEVMGLTRFIISSSQHLPQTGYVRLSQIDPREHLSRLRDPREYIPRMAGGFNRLNELGDHIKCRECKNNMIFDLKYSIKDFAVYMQTVANCGDGNPGHDHNVYLSHCHGCSKIIDSRDDRIRDGEGYCICMNCGTGGYKMRPGTICPKCGAGVSYMVPSEYGWYHCNHCGHEIHVPNKSR